MVSFHQVPKHVGQTRVVSQKGTYSESGCRMQLAVGTTIRRVETIKLLTCRPSIISWISAIWIMSLSSMMRIFDTNRNNPSSVSLIVIQSEWKQTSRIKLPLRRMPWLIPLWRRSYSSTMRKRVPFSCLSLWQTIRWKEMERWFCIFSRLIRFRAILGV